MANTSKRAFPYYTAVEGLELKRQAIEGVNPGAERAAPRVFEPARFTEVGSAPGLHALMYVRMGYLCSAALAGEA